MGLKDWLRPPRHLFALFAAVTLLPAAALVWLGWQFFERDRAFEEQRVQRRLQASAERVSLAIVKELESAAQNLPAWLADPPADVAAHATLIRIGPTGIVAKTGAPLSFAPVVAPSSLLAEPLFERSLQVRWDEAQGLEYREKDLGKAAAAYAAIATTVEPQPRAHALLAAARCLRNLGRRDRALDHYRALKQLPGTMLNGEPGDLVGRAAECKLLDELDRRDELSSAARSLAGDLARGRWIIDKGTFEARIAELRQWTPVVIDADALSRSHQLDLFWSNRPSGSLARSGHQSFLQNNTAGIVVWRVQGDDVIALAGGDRFLSRTWQNSLADKDTRVSFENPGGATVKLRAGDIGLPRDLFVSDVSAASESVGSDRRRLLGWGLVALVMLILAAGYLVFRVVHRELAVARLQTDFVSAVSHEFRTPLTSMAHLTERLQRDSSIPEDRKREYYGVLARDTDRLRRFVETLLDFGRMEAGAGSVRTKREDLAGVVSDVVSEFRGDSAALDREVHVQASGALPPVELDREAFGRALWNLLENASKYSPAGAPITVTVRQDGGAACVDVSDRGAGIPPGERRQIFQKFVRGEDSKAAGIKGTGVGLALVDRIVRAHGGEVRLESVVGEGSTFSLVLPVHGTPQS